MSKSIWFCLGLAGILCLVVSVVVVRANQDRPMSTGYHLGQKSK